jgi:two-component system response regulator BaeR
MTKTILIIEDECDLASLISDYVSNAGFIPRVIHNGIDAINEVRTSLIDCLVLDVMLPGLDGVSVCREIRRFSTIPIIMATAKVEEIDRLLGLEIGADDYLCKPFSPRELIARIKTILRRVENAKDASGSTSFFQVDPSKHCITVHQHRLDLTPSEYSILAHLIQHPGQLFSRAQLLDLTFQENLDVTDRAIDSHIKNLRRKLQVVLPNHTVIHSVYGLGYCFDFQNPT